MPTRPRSSLRLGAFALALLAGAARAQGPASAPDAPPTRAEAPAWFGVALDAGFPDGLAASALFRPWRPLRLDAGVTYNVLAFGLRAGATLLLPDRAVAPLVRVEVGHNFGADASGLADRFATLTTAERILLADVSYTYVGAQVGAEFRTSSRSAIFVRGRLAYFTAPVHGFEAALQTQNAGATAAEATVHATAPTLSVGFLMELF